MLRSFRSSSTAAFIVPNRGVLLNGAGGGFDVAIPTASLTYAGDVRGWLGWLADRGTDVLGAGRVHVDLWVAGQQDQGAESSIVRRRLSGDYTVDEFGFDEDFTEHAYLPLLRPLYRSWFRVEVRGAGSQQGDAAIPRLRREVRPQHTRGPVVAEDLEAGRSRQAL